MPYKPGETNWFDNLSPELKDVWLRKPFTATNGEDLATLAAIVSLLPPPPLRILDVGCGNGFLSNTLSLCGYEVEGTDICKSLIQNNIFNVWENSYAEFTVMDWDHLPTSSYDVIIFVSALHHSRNLNVTLKSCFDALTPCGLFIASEPGIFHTGAKYSKDWAEKFDVTEKSTPPYKIVREGRKVGFVDCKVYPNPISVHKGLYQLEGLNHHPVIKFLVGLPMGILGTTVTKWLHGLTTMRKAKK